MTCQWRASCMAFIAGLTYCQIGLATAQDGTPLVADIAEPVVEISYSFSGTQLLVFGATYCTQDQPDAPCHLVAVMEGPPAGLVVRRKERKNGVWINGASAAYDQAPGYYAYAATAPLEDILSPALAKQLSAGLDNINLAADTADEDSAQLGFRNGLIADRSEKGLYVAAQQTITVRENRLFRMSFPAPATVPIGTYTIRIFAIMNDEILAQTSQSLVVRKAGFEAFVTTQAQTSPLLYGVISIILALSIGFISASVFKK